MPSYRNTLKAKIVVSIMFFLSLLTFGLPYIILKDIASFTASYLYWTLITAIVIALGAFYVRKWGN